MDTEPKLIPTQANFEKQLRNAFHNGFNGKTGVEAVTALNRKLVKEFHPDLNAGAAWATQATVNLNAAKTAVDTYTGVKPPAIQTEEGNRSSKPEPKSERTEYPFDDFTNEFSKFTHEFQFVDFAKKIVPFFGKGENVTGFKEAWKIKFSKEYPNN